jgi:hypothetical protein
MSIGDSKMPGAKKAAMKRMRNGGKVKRMRGGGAAIPKRMKNGGAAKKAAMMRGGGNVSPRKAMGMMRGGKVKK